MAVHKDILDGFWNLSENKDSIRLQSTVKIINHIQNENESIEYVLKRLVRGLSSSRGSVRQGFFVCFVEVLRQIKDDNIIDKIKQLMDEHLQSKTTKSEEGESLCGQLFCYGALLRSGCVSHEMAPEIVKNLLTISKKRSYLLIPGYAFLIDYLSTMTTEDFIAKLWPTINQIHNWLDQSWSLEMLWVLLAIQDVHPKALNKKFMMESFGRKKLVSEELCEKAAQIKDDSSIPIHIMKSHPVHSLLLKVLSKENLVHTFWVKYVDRSLSKNSKYKSFLGFNILAKILESLEDKSNYEEYLTLNFVETALFYLSRLESSPDEDQVIFDILNKFVSAAEENTNFQKQLYKTLLTHPGNIAFDKITGGNVIQQLTLNSTKEALMYSSTFYKEALLASKKDSKWTTQERIFSAQQLAKLILNNKLQDCDEWRFETLKFMFVITFLDIKDEIVEPLESVPGTFSREARIQLPNIFYKALNFRAKKFIKVGDELVKMAHFANTLMKSPKICFYKSLSATAQKAWNTMIKDIDVMAKKSNSKKEDSVFKLLFIRMGFQMLSDQDAIIDILADLKQCYTRAIQSTSMKTRRKSKLDSNEPLWVEVTVDVLLSLQSQNKNVLRQLVSSVFSMLCNHLTTDAIQSILDVIKDTKKNEEENEESDDEYEDMEEDEEEEEEENGKSSDEEDEDEEEDEEDEEEDEEEGEPANKDGDDLSELRDKVKEVLGEHAAESDEESINMDDISDGDMKKMDEALANVFRQLSGKKSGSQKKKEKKDSLAVMHFKIRALDLIDVYLSHEPSMSHLIIIMEQILAALNGSMVKKEEQPLQSRLKNTLKRVTNHKKPKQLNPQENFDNSSIVQALKGFVDLANNKSPLMPLLNNPIPLFAQCCLLLLKMSFSINDKDLTNQVNEIYNSAIEDFFLKTECMLPSAFFDLPMQGSWNGSWNLAKKLIKYSISDDSIRQFRKTQGVGLLVRLFRNKNIQTAENAKTIKSVVKALKEPLLSVISKFEAEKPLYYTELLNLLHALRVSNAELDWEEVKDIMEKIRDKIPRTNKFQNVKKAFNKIAQQLNTQIIQGSEKRKRKNSECKEPINGVNGKNVEKRKRKKSTSSS